MHRRRLAPAVSTLLLVAIVIPGCSGSTAPSAVPSTAPSTVSSASAAPTSVSASPQSLECETAGYPCSLAEVGPAVLERSNALGDQAAVLLRDGGTIAEVEAFLTGQDGMAEVESDELVVRFRLDGGRNVWVTTAAALGGDSQSSGSAPKPPIDDSYSLVAAHSIVGAESEAKSALVLSPFKWYFGATDDGAAVAAMLEKTRGYAGNVTYLENATEASTNVGIDSFKGWRADQVIHVSSHGARICKVVPCHAVIIAGVVTRPAGAITEPGVELLKAATGPGRGLQHEDDPVRSYLALAADFFRIEYQGGLDASVVFFNACSTYGTAATDLGDAIRGQTSAFLGWSEPVDSAAAQSAAAALYGSIGRDGFGVDTAYEGLGALQVDPRLKHAQLMMAGPETGHDLRIRQVAAFRTSDGLMLSAADRVSIKGTAGDGQPDSVSYTVTVDGVAPDTASKATVNVSIDGVAAAPVALSTGSEVAPGRWSLSGEIVLGYDVTADKVVDFRASADLPEGGTSTHATSATIAGSPVMGLTWKGWATDVGDANGDGSVKVRSRAELTFRYKAGQKAGMHPRYELVDGTVTWRIDGTSSDGCRVLSPEVTVTTPDIDPNAELVFDLTANPVEYMVSTNMLSGPLVEVSVKCPSKSSTYTTRVSFIFATQGDHPTVTGDTIAGSYRLGVGEYAWELTRAD